MTPLTLVIDQGTHATRALAFDEHGRIQASAYCPIALHGAGSDHVEQDAAEIVASMWQVLHELLDHPEVKKRGIARAGMATQRSSVVAWDRESGEPLAPMLSWQDRRAADWLAQFSQHEPEIKSRTGLPLSPHYGASKLRWLLDNVPAVAQAHREGRLAFGPLVSFLLFHLLDERPLLTDHANASRTLLWHVADRDWDAWLLDLFGVPKDPLPVCVPICHEYGRIRGTGIPLLAVNGDQNAAVFALGRPLPGTAVVNMGTGAFILLPTGKKLHPHPALLSGLIHSDATKGTYTIEGTVNGAGAALSWAVAQWQLPDPKAHLPQWLAEVSHPPLFLNSIGGLGSPLWRPGPEPALVGDAAGVGETAAAVIESILFLLHINLETMTEMGLPVRRLQISGGLSQVDGLCQRLANLTGREVYRPAEVEATARGAAYLAAGLPGHWPKPGRGRWFRPVVDEGLRARYGRFRELITT